MIFLVQFGINKHAQFVVFEKIKTSACLFQIAREKSCDYVLIIYMKKYETAHHK